jgi:SAM-dependent methyltransferase
MGRESRTQGDGINNRGTGPGARTADGSSVELYKLLADRGEADLIHSALRERATILELGCGSGRVTHPLVALGHEVTAVDFSQEMLAEIQGAERVFADIATLRMDKTFDGVVLGSTLVNVARGDVRRKFLETCAFHVAPRGRVLVECHANSLLERAVPGYLGEENGVVMSWREVRRDGNLVSGTLEYRYGARVWTQTFSTRFLEEDEIRRELAACELRFEGWLNDRHSWFAAARS